MKFKFSSDFLRNAQWLKPLEMPPERDIVLTSFDQKFVGFGSCFAQNLKAVIEPFHFSFWFNREICAHYSTQTLLQTLRRASGTEPHQEDEFYEVDENPEDVVLTNYWKLRFFGPNARVRARDTRDILDKELLKNVAEGDIFIITLGNSVIFKPKTRNTVPCNLYGLTLEDFYMYQQTPEDVERDLIEIYSILLRIREGRTFKMFVTISPQRYLYDPKDLEFSAVENNCLMKSVLKVAVNSFVKSKAAEGVRYFPAYEMVMEELRLYETLSTYDHTHINQDFTPRYVVKKFLKRHASDAVLGILPIIEGIKELLDETNLDLSRGAAGTNPFIVEPWLELFKRLVVASREVFPRQLWASALDIAAKLGIANHLREVFSGENLSEDMNVAVSWFYQQNNRSVHLASQMIQDFTILVENTNNHMAQGALGTDISIVEDWKSFFKRMLDVSQESFHNELWNTALDCADKIGIKNHLGDVFSNSPVSDDVRALLYKFYSLR